MVCQAAGMRARVWMRSKELCELSHYLKTKKESLLAFKEGRLLINGQVTPPLFVVLRRLFVVVLRSLLCCVCLLFCSLGSNVHE